MFGQLDVALEGRSVLDVGCGRGFVGEFVERMGGRYAGVDFVASRPGFPFAHADAARLPFPDAAFDAVFCIDAFEHFPDGETVAREIRRVLRPGGFFFLSAPNYSNVAGVVKWGYETFGRYKRNTWAPFGRWRPQELEQPLTGAVLGKIFRQAGFVSSVRVGLGREIGLGLFPWIEHPGMPDRVRFRLQRLAARVGPAIVKVWPGASLHCFYKFDVPNEADR